jgi:hypothetical protein
MKTKIFFFVILGIAFLTFSCEKDEFVFPEDSNPKEIVQDSIKTDSIVMDSIIILDPVKDTVYIDSLIVYDPTKDEKYLLSNFPNYGNGYDSEKMIDHLGGDTWLTGLYDPENNEVYIMTLGIDQGRFIGSLYRGSIQTETVKGTGGSYIEETEDQIRVITYEKDSIIILSLTDAIGFGYFYLNYQKEGDTLHIYKNIGKNGEERIDIGKAKFDNIEKVKYMDMSMELYDFEWSANPDDLEVDSDKFIGFFSSTPKISFLSNAFVPSFSDYFGVSTAVIFSIANDQTVEKIF